MARFPLKTMLAAVLVSYLFVTSPPLSIGFGFGTDSMKKAEFYPFSSFPMSHRFSDRPIYVYVSDTDNNPVAAVTELGTLSSALKKFYDARLREIKKSTGTALRKMSPADKLPAGLDTLRHVKSLPSSEQSTHQRTLRLHEVTITFQNGKPTKSDLVVAEL